MGVSESSEITDYVVIEKCTKTQPPSVEKPLVDIVCGPNEDVELSCIFGGIPQPKVSWSKDGKKLKTAKATYENRVATLVILSSQSTEGHYKCIATNDFGEAETSCNLEIQQKPLITIPDNEINQKHKVGSEWIVTATILAIPNPQITWYKNGTKISKSLDIDIVTEGNISIIKILNLDRSHTGKYSIEAQNKAGTSVIEVSLRVFGEYDPTIDILV